MKMKRSKNQLLTSILFLKCILKQSRRNDNYSYHSIFPRITNAISLTKGSRIFIMINLTSLFLSLHIHMPNEPRENVNPAHTRPHRTHTHARTVYSNTQKRHKNSLENARRAQYIRAHAAARAREEKSRARLRQFFSADIYIQQHSSRFAWRWEQHFPYSFALASRESRKGAFR